MQEMPRDRLNCKRQIFGRRIGADLAVLTPNPIPPIDVAGNEEISSKGTFTISFSFFDGDPERYDAACSTIIE
jgi:hypothetical protein